MLAISISIADCSPYYLWYLGPPTNTHIFQAFKCAPFFSIHIQAVAPICHDCGISSPLPGDLWTPLGCSLSPHMYQVSPRFNPGHFCGLLSFPRVYLQGLLPKVTLSYRLEQVWRKLHPRKDRCTAGVLYVPYSLAHWTPLSQKTLLDIYAEIYFHLWKSEVGCLYMLCENIN